MMPNLLCSLPILSGIQLQLTHPQWHSAAPATCSNPETGRWLLVEGTPSVTTLCMPHHCCSLHNSRQGVTTALALRRSARLHRSRGVCRSHNSRPVHARPVTKAACTKSVGQHSYDTMFTRDPKHMHARTHGVHAERKSNSCVLSESERKRALAGCECR